MRAESGARANWRVARTPTITSRRNVDAIQTGRGFRLENASSPRLCPRPAAIQRSSISKSRGLCQRASGSLIRHVLTTCSSASEEPMGQTVENTIRSSSRIGVVRPPAAMRSKARRPEIISYNTAPKLKMSDRASASRPASCSGDMSLHSTKDHARSRQRFSRSMGSSVLCRRAAHSCQPEIEQLRA